jgi:hypothetical protein
MHAVPHSPCMPSLTHHACRPSLTMHAVPHSPCMPSLTFVRLVPALILVLATQDQRIWVNPKECLVCREYPREVTLNCGHAILCMHCYARVHVCPICRDPIERQQATPPSRQEQYHTNAVPRRAAADRRQTGR